MQTDGAILCLHAQVKLHVATQQTPTFLARIDCCEEQVADDTLLTPVLARVGSGLVKLDKELDRAVVVVIVDTLRVENEGVVLTLVLAAEGVALALNEEGNVFCPGASGKSYFFFRLTLLALALGLDVTLLDATLASDFTDRFFFSVFLLHRSLF